MYLIAAIVGLMYVVLFLLAGKEETEITGVQKPFYKAAALLFRAAGKINPPGEKRVRKELELLNPGEPLDRLAGDYYVKKTALLLEIIFAGTIASGLISLKAYCESAVPEDGKITRRSFQEDGQNLSLTITGEDAYELNIAPRQLSRDEADELYGEFRDKMRVLMLGENASAEQVSSTLVLETELEDYPFTAEWASDLADIVNTLGEVCEVEEPIQVVLTMTAYYADWEWNEEFVVNVVPPDLTEEERRERAIQKLLISAEEKTREEQFVLLPQEYRGEFLDWKWNVKDHGIQIWIGTIGLSVILFFMSDKDLHGDLERRREILKRDYPEIVQKFVLYMGAGMTARNTLKKLASDYEKNEKNRGKSSPAYDELLYSCRELLSGVPESEMYERLGRRTGIQEYIRLCTLLQQNVRKGNSAILERLRDEAARSMGDKLQNCRRLGEEAGTKLLLPMVMMLLVTMVIIMIPVFMSSML